MLQVGIGIAIKQVSSLSDQVFLRNLTKAVAIKQEHVVLALIICRFLFKIAPNMMKGIANLTSTSSLLRYWRISLYILLEWLKTRDLFLAQSCWQRARWLLVSIFLLASYQFPGNMETKLYLKYERINYAHHPSNSFKNFLSSASASGVVPCSWPSISSREAVWFWIAWFVVLILLTISVRGSTSSSSKVST